MRKGTYKLKRVTGYFQAAPFDWANSADPVLRATRWTFLVMDCGHVKRDPWEAYQNETVVRVKATLHHTYQALGAPTATRRVRCWQCMTGRPHTGTPKEIPVDIIRPTIGVNPMSRHKKTEIFSIFGQIEEVAATMMIEKGEIKRIEPADIPETAFYNAAGVPAKFAVIVPGEQVQKFNELIARLRA